MFRLLALVVFVSAMIAALRDLWNLLEVVWLEFLVWSALYFLAWKLANRYVGWLARFTLVRAVGLYLLVIGWKAGLPLYIEGHEAGGLLLLAIGTCVGLALLTLQGIDSFSTKHE